VFNKLLVVAELAEALPVLKVFPKLIFVCTGLNEELGEKFVKAGLTARVGDGFLFILVIFGRRLVTALISENVTGDEEADEFDELEAESLLLVIVSISEVCMVSFKTGGEGEEFCKSRLELKFLPASWNGDEESERGGGMTRSGDLRVLSVVVDDKMDFSDRVAVLVAVSRSDFDWTRFSAGVTWADDAAF